MGGAGILFVIRGEVRKQLESSLTAVLDSQVSALRHWLDVRYTCLQTVVREPEIREPIVAAFSTGQLPNPERLQQFLDRLVEPLGVSEWRLVDADGVILMDSEHGAAKRAATLLLDPIKSACESGKTLFVPPQLLDVDKTPRMAIIVPMPGKEGSAPGALIARIDPRGEFSHLLKGGRLGSTGETYAFDMQARLISETRHLDELRRRGLVPEDAETSVFNVHLRRSRGVAPGTDPLTLPMTEMAAKAVQGHDGVDLDGYTDSRGIKSVAAWRVLKDLGFAVVTKQDAAEAYAPLRVLWTVFLGVLLVLTATAAVAAVLARRNQTARRRLAKAEARVQTLGQYRLETKLGQGGMGVVYRASHAMLRRPTAVKLMLGGNSSVDAARFEREAQLTCSLTHPNTVIVYDFGSTEEGQIYYAMEYLDGLTLDEMITYHGALPPGRVVYLLAQVCSALEEAHVKGLIHRDIKPANIFASVRAGLYDFVKVLDFGLAKRFDGGSGNLTSTSAICGTPLYMCPEIIEQRGDIDARSDLYAIGCVAYHLLTGRAPFSAPALAGLLHSHLHEAPVPPSRYMPVPPDLEAIVLACLAKRPEDRPADARVLRERLLACACASEWNEVKAEDWWRAHGTKTEREEAETVMGFVAPLEVTQPWRD
jgi:hypothetical protein